MGVIEQAIEIARQAERSADAQKQMEAARQLRQIADELELSAMLMVSADFDMLGEEIAAKKLRDVA